MTEVAICEGRIVAWVPGRLRNSLNSKRGHWSLMHRYQKQWRERTKLCVTDALNRSRPQHMRPDREKLIVMTAYVWNLFDEDGLAAALKPIVDGLVDSKVIHRDDVKGGHRFVRRQQINRKHRGVEIVVEPA